MDRSNMEVAAEAVKWQDRWGTRRVGCLHWKPILPPEFVMATKPVAKWLIFSVIRVGSWVSVHDLSETLKRFGLVINHDHVYMTHNMTHNWHHAALISLNCLICVLFATECFSGLPAVSFQYFSINSLMCLFDAALTSVIQSAPTSQVKWLALDDFITKSTCTQICLSDILRFGTLFQIYSHQDFNCLSQMKWQYFQSIPIDIQFSSSHKSHSEVHVKADFCSLKHLRCFLRTPSDIINLE